MISVTLNPDGSGLVIEFDLPTNQANLPTTFDCAVLFNQYDTFGKRPSLFRHSDLQNDFQSCPRSVP